RFTNGVPIDVCHLGLNEHQVKAWNLPTRPAKKTDSRAKKFIERYGDVSVELDALTPHALRQLVDDAISQHMDPDRLAMLKGIETFEREQIQKLFEQMPPGPLD